MQVPRRLQAFVRRLWPLSAPPRCSVLPVSRFFSKGPSGEEEDEEERSQQQKYDGIRTQYILPDVGHKVFLVQPARRDKRRLTVGKTEDMKEEARALVDSLETWRIVQEVQVSLRHTAHDVLFTPGVFDDLSRVIRANKEATAVFVNWPLLSGLQLASLQKAWSKAVYDRFTLVLQIFRLHSRTREARLQVALAEIPYLRSRIAGIHIGVLPGMGEGLTVQNISEQMPLALKMEFLEGYEHKLRQKIKKLEQKREFLRRRRRLSDTPLVTVIGYTNAGKTSLIRQLTLDRRVVPCDKLFATLDTSHHGGHLPNSMRVIFVDTIGFLSDIPTSLLAAFRATLKDCMDTDLLLHVIDISHVHYKSQIATVHKIIDELDLPQSLTSSMIEVANKSDKVSEDEVEKFRQEFPHVLPVSCKTQAGLLEVRTGVQKALQENLGFIRKRLKVRIGGTIYDWLHSEATVEDFEACPDDQNKAIITVLFTPTAMARFKAMFEKSKAT